MTILAKELVKREYDVSFVTFEKSCISPEIISRLKVYNPFNNKGRGYTYFYPQNMYKTLKTLNEIDADIYIQRAGTPLTGILTFFSRLNNKVFIFSSSSNGNVSTNLSIMKSKDIRKLIYKYGVQYADCVVCQSAFQKELLWQTIRKKGKIIKNVYILPNIRHKKNDDSKIVLWVGRIGKEKRPELFLKLSKENPGIKFIMIGGPSGTDFKYYNKIEENAKKISNLDFVGFVPNKKIDYYYTKASVFVNTSHTEGFPNTFLEAWGNYTPVVSLNYDPDEIICKYKLGFHSHDLNDLEKHIYILLENADLRRKMGENGRSYVEREHSIDKILGEYEKLFEILF